MGFTVWQQRRAEELAKVRPDQEDDAGFRPVSAVQSTVTEAGLPT